MKIDARALEAAILARIPELDRTHDGKVDAADLEELIADAREEIEDRAGRDPVKALLAGIVVGGIVGAALVYTMMRLG